MLNTVDDLKVHRHHLEILSPAFGLADISAAAAVINAQTEMMSGHGDRQMNPLLICRTVPVSPVDCASLGGVATSQPFRHQSLEQTQRWRLPTLGDQVEPCFATGECGDRRMRTV